MANDPRMCRTGCGRPVHADGLCKTHHQKGENYEIRPYLPRDPRRCEYAGVPVLRSTRRALVAAERQTKMAARALVGAILDAWAGKKTWSPMLSRAGVAAGLALVCAGALGLRCTPNRHAEISDTEPTKTMPDKPLQGQGRPPCKRPTVSRLGGCWVPLIDPDTGKQLRGCKDDDEFYVDPNDPEQKCYLPSYPKGRRPTAVEDAAERRSE